MIPLYIRLSILTRVMNNQDNVPGGRHSQPDDKIDILSNGECDTRGVGMWFSIWDEVKDKVST